MTERLRVAMRDWMELEAELAHQRKPHIRPFPVDDFDGCTLAPNTVLACCYLHDLAYFHAENSAERRAADVAFCACIIEKTKLENLIWRWWWRGTAWTYYGVVRLVGGWAVAKHRKARGKA